MVDASPRFLIGFMATGKSTAGPACARRMGRRFVDLDEEVARAAGKDVPTIFRDDGEAAFRRLEAEAVDRLAGQRNLVVACGGGTPCFEGNLARMRAAGVVACLRASLDDVLARAAAGEGGLAARPLLAAGDARAAAERLYRQREAVYLSADFVIDTSGRQAEEVGDELARRAALRLGTVGVRLGERSYPIHLAPLAEAGALAAELLKKPSAVAVISDANVARAGHVASVRRALEAAGLPAVEVVVAPGEGSKNLVEVGRVAEACIKAGLDRRGALLAVGGGVVGDLAGFAAAILYRGVRYAQVPTSLLAMVDSAIGGKTGVDLPGGKNLLGAFWQPRFVLCDVAALATLPERERRGALGEVVKYGLMADAALVVALEREGARVDPGELVLACARIKAGVVSRDERETTGERALLNLGHTVGHAIEAASAYALLHGECVGLGLIAAARVSQALSLCDPGLEARVTALLASLGLPTGLDDWLRDDVLSYMAVDKKRAGGKVRFVALEGPGRPRLVDLAPDELTRILRSGTTR